MQYIIFVHVATNRLDDPPKNSSVSPQRAPPPLRLCSILTAVA